jgi:regulatory ArsR family protein
MMRPEALSEVISSTVRLRIMDGLSLRPRTLNELSDIAGTSVQGLIRYLNRLENMGLVEKRKVSANAPKARIVYAVKDALVGDYSMGDLTIVKASERGRPEAEGTGPSDPEGLAGEILIQRRRIADQARRLGRSIDELVADREALIRALQAMPLTEDELLILTVVLTEETAEEGERVLSRYYGIEGRRSIDEALAKAKRSVGK